MYNLVGFGNEIKNIRKRLGLSQDDVSHMTNISSITLRRIEHGKNMPLISTIDALSTVYKVNLMELLYSYGFAYPKILDNIINSLDKKLYNKDYNSISEDLVRLENIISYIENEDSQESGNLNKEYLKKLKIDQIKQMIAFYEGVRIRNVDKDYVLSIEKFIKAISFSTNNFSMENYMNLVYSTIEIRILTNIAISYFKMDDKDKYLEILEFCMDSVEDTDPIFPQVCHNLANAYKRMDMSEKAEIYINKAIKSIQDESIPIGLDILFYSKGNCEEKLGKECLESFKTAIYYSRAVGNKKLEKIILDKLRKFSKLDSVDLII